MHSVTSEQHPFFISKSSWAPSGSLLRVSRGQEQGVGKLGSYLELQGRICSQTHSSCWESSVPMTVRLMPLFPCACQQGITPAPGSHLHIASRGLPSICKARTSAPKSPVLSASLTASSATSLRKSSAGVRRVSPPRPYPSLQLRNHWAW